MAHTIVMPDNTQVTLAWAAITDLGMRREVNEDSVLAAAPLFVVADGMGGHAAGDVASAAVVNRLAEYSGKASVDPDDLNSALVLAVEDMRQGPGVIDQRSGTTVTGIALGIVQEVPSWIVFNIGDSRVYHLSGGTLEQLTVDHSVVQQLVDAGYISSDEAETHPHSNVITRAVGFHENPTPDYLSIPLQQGDRLLVCSDGLTKEITQSGIQHFLSEGGDPEQTAQQLLHTALGNGGRDNISAIVIDVVRVES